VSRQLDISTLPVGLGLGVVGGGARYNDIDAADC
jgi:hypothetical protein